MLALLAEICLLGTQNLAEIFSSRQIALIDFPCTSDSRYLCNRLLAKTVKDITGKNAALVKGTTSAVVARLRSLIGKLK